MDQQIIDRFAELQQAVDTRATGRTLRLLNAEYSSGLQIGSTDIILTN